MGVVAAVGVVAAAEAYHGVHGLIWRGHRVQKRLEAALEHLHKGLLDRVATGAAEDAVLENVGHASVVLWERAEVAREDLVLVVGVQREHLARNEPAARERLQRRSEST